ncbi:exocyst complex component Sec6-domain-containing protein [Gilbertella persicaria]|uniref:exocyst complex component Sec6-domain-containing protein n=1 Tax=Gilbertella persicaria TaxID=101096 RepID=UPI00221F5AF2|nr:exocyst complex component Sec6-domain-containing protein [Gilbertella persicaria]KAI8073404.1 exocyst complex component Sec6-domain-containing protein [Gilbertella persicaria]
MEDDAKELAINKLAELLKHPDDLNTKLAPLTRKLAKEKASIDAQLNTGVQSQLDHVQEGLETLTISSRNINRVKDNMRNIDKLCYDAQSMIKDFPRINMISQVHQHFVATQAKVKAFQALYQQLDDLEEAFAPMRHDIFHPHDALLHVHYHLFKLEEFRDKTMHQARDSPHDAVITLKTYFRRVDVLSDDFTQHLWLLTRHLVDLIDHDCGATIIKLIKIIECEEAADEKALAAKQAQFNHQDLQGHKKWRLAEGNPRTIKSYRVEFFEQLHQSLQDRFEQVFLPYKEQEDWSSALDATEFIFDELELVYDEIVPKFPKKYKIFPYFVLEYHRHTYDLLNQMVQQDLDAGTMLRLLRFVRDYYTTMSTRLGVTEELLEPQLLDGQEQSLVDEYLKLVRRKLVEWTSNLMQSESQKFVNRKEPPEMAQDGQFGLSGAVDLFQIINQQIDVAADANQGKLLYLVIHECHKVMKDAQSFWKRLLQTELQKQLEQPEDAPEGFVEYVMALANDQIKCSDFANDILMRVPPIVDANYKTQVEDKLSTAIDGYLQIAASAREALLEVTFGDIKPVFSDLFTTRWYAQPLIPSVIETLRDYCNDFGHLNAFIFEKLIRDMLDRFLMLYLEAMRHKSAKFHMPACLEKVENDVRLSFQFFVEYTSVKEMEERFDVIEKVHKLLESNRRMIFVDYYNLRQAYPDVPLAFVENILSKRDDLDKSALKDIMEGIKAKAREYEPDANTPPTIFSRIKW